MRRKIKISLLLIIPLVVIFSSVYFFEGKKKELNIKSETQNAKRETKDDNVQLENNNAQENENTPEDIKADAASVDNSENKKEETAQDEKTEETKTLSGITNRLVSWGYQKASSRTIDTIIIHSTYNAVGSDPFDLGDIINKEYKPYGVSPHYIIDRKGSTYRLVEDKNIAYHAGESKMPDGRTNVNNFSIGIEIVNNKTESPTSAQYSALKNLIASLKAKYKIKYVLGHDDIAPGRKDDPWNFDWGKVK